MLKIKLFDPKHPTESQELELPSDRLNHEECLIGRSPACVLVLPSPQVQEVQGKIYIEDGHYYFSNLTGKGKTQYNDEAAESDRPYRLETDDIIRMGDFVLIVDGLPSTGKPKFKPAKLPKPPQGSTVAAISSPEPQGRARRSLKDIKSLTRKTRRDDSPTSANSSEPPTVLPLPPTLKFANGSEPPNVLPFSPATWTQGEIKVRCASIIEETADVKTFRLVAEPPLLFDYKPGQFVTLQLNIDGKSIKRSYSISSAPSRPQTLEITVKRVPPPPDIADVPSGLVSNWLHDSLNVGSELTLSGSYGKFTCADRPDAQKLLFISAGSGITPLMSMSRWILDTAAKRDILFFHSGRSPRDLIFRQELELMAARHANFNLVFTITRPEAAEVWPGLTGRLNETMIETIAPDFRERTVYVCGPDSFMQGVKALLTGLKFPMDNYYQESFGAAKKAPPTSTPASAGTVVFSQSVQEVTSDGTVSLLALAEQETIALDSSCRNGACGTCKVKKVFGEIRYEGQPDALTSSDEAGGYILSCIAYPVGRVVLEV